MLPKDKKIIAIIRRDQNGSWRRVQSVATNKGDNVILLPTEKGLIAVLGEPSDEEYQEISRLIEGITSSE